MIILRYREPPDLDRFLEKNGLQRGNIVHRFVTSAAVAIRAPAPALERLTAVGGTQIVRDVRLSPVPAIPSRRRFQRGQRDEAAREVSAPSFLPAVPGPAPVGVAIMDAGIEPRADLGIVIPQERRWDFYAGQPAPDKRQPAGSHGSQMAYVATRPFKGQPSNVTLWSLRVDKANEMAVAVDWAVQYNAAPGPDGPIRILCTARSFTQVDDAARAHLEETISGARANDIVTCVALGNVPPLLTPATAPGAITVGAYYENRDGPEDDVVRSFESTPSPADFRKPNVLCRWYPHPIGVNNDGSGTSLATAYLARAIAIWMGTKPDLTPDAIDAHIESSKEHLQDPLMRSSDQGGFPVVRDPGFPPMQSAPPPLSVAVAPGPSITAPAAP
ncbi:MAG: S8 family serine peptidase [Minicystis sp.]